MIGISFSVFAFIFIISGCQDKEPDFCVHLPEFIVAGTSISFSCETVYSRFI